LRHRSDGTADVADVAVDAGPVVAVACLAHTVARGTYSAAVAAAAAVDCGGGTSTAVVDGVLVAAAAADFVIDLQNEIQS
jgi:hypothetical protein